MKTNNPAVETMENRVKSANDKKRTEPVGGAEDTFSGIPLEMENEEELTEFLEKPWIEELPVEKTPSLSDVATENQDEHFEQKIRKIFKSNAPLVLMKIRQKHSESGENNETLSGQTGFISGRITDEFYQPLSDIGIIGKIPGSVSMDTWSFTLSDENGNYIIEGLMDATYMLWAQSDDYINEEKSNIAVNTAGVDFMLKIGGGIDGRITPSAGDADVTAIIQTKRMFAGWFSGKDGVVADDGSFSINGLPEGSYIVQASAPGYKNALITDVSVSLNSRAAGIVLELEKGGLIKGRVVDKTTGNPVTYGNLTIKRTDGILFAKGIHKEFSEGNFSFDGLDDGIYNITVDASGYVNKKSSDIIISGTNSVDNIVMELEEKTERIAGVVLDKNTGEPVSGAVITAVEDVIIKLALEKDIRRTMSAADGSFELNNMANAAYNLITIADNYALLKTKVKISKYEDIGGLEVLLSSDAGHITGAVKDQFGKPVGLKKIILVPADVNDTINNIPIEFLLYQFDVTNEKGEYEIANVQPGSYKLVVLYYTFLSVYDSSQIYPVEVAGNTTTVMDIKLETVAEETCRVYGRVLLDGKPVQSYDVYFSDPYFELPTEKVSIDEAGEYSISLKKGKEYFYLLNNLANRIGKLDVPVESKFEFDIEIPHFNVSGKILDAKTNEPVFGADVWLTRNYVRMESGPQGQWNLAAGKWKTDITGEFEIKGLSGGDFILHVSRQNYSISLREITITDSNMENVIISMPHEGGVIKGNISDVTGGPVTGVYFGIEDIDFGTQIMCPYISLVPHSEDGTYSLTGINGNVRITAMAKGFAPASKEVAVKNNEDMAVDFIMTKGGNLNLKVMDITNSPVKNADITVKNSDGKLIDSVITFLNGKYLFLTDKNGEYKIENIPAGDYTGIIKKDGYSDKIFNFSIYENTNETVLLVIE
ncbi:MAG: carboxypeptidase regulatory-like domain-containing protein [Planctomycetes bacterium]|nr:carboxypeptidase regulatory-like domain-containing protein [Planctomycetota bacterium]